MVKNEEDVLKMFGEGFDCSQIVLSQVSEKLGITREEALKIAACFGGGMWHGETCGCVVGALIALGMKYATTEANDQEKKDKFLKKCEEWYNAYKNTDMEKINSIANELNGNKYVLSRYVDCMKENKIIQNMTAMVNNKNALLTENEQRLCQVI